MLVFNSIGFFGIICNVQEWIPLFILELSQYYSYCERLAPINFYLKIHEHNGMLF